MSGIKDFLKALAGICETKPLPSQLWDVRQNIITVKLADVPNLQSRGGAVYVKGKGLMRPVLIVHADDGQYLAVENRCTHMGRKLDPVAGQPLLRCCSVNHSTFDYDGKKLTGPGSKPIRVYRTDFSDGDLLIDIG